MFQELFYQYYVMTDFASGDTVVSRLNYKPLPTMSMFSSRDSIQKLPNF